MFVFIMGKSFNKSYNDWSKPNVSNCVFCDISHEWILSEEMKKFSEIAQMKRVDFLKARQFKKTSLGTWQPIPVTSEEADHNYYPLLTL